MQRAAAERRYTKIHEAMPFHNGSFTHWAKEPDSDHPFHYLDGVSIWTTDRDLTPDDDFLGQNPREDPPAETT